MDDGDLYGENQQGPVPGQPYEKNNIAQLEVKCIRRRLDHRNLTHFPPLCFFPVLILPPMVAQAGAWARGFCDGGGDKPP